MKALLRRKLELFGVKLEWDGVYVRALQMTGKRGRPCILECHKAWALSTATRKMNEIEEQYHNACTAMA